MTSMTRTAAQTSTRTGRASRWTALGASSAVAALLLAGCGGADTTDSTPQTPAATASPTAGAAAAEGDAALTVIDRLRVLDLRGRRAQHGGGYAAGEHRQHASVQARDRARLCAQRDLLRRHLGRGVGHRPAGSIVLIHAQFLRVPSVRSMRTTSPLSPPRRSSAAPNSRSTM